MLKLCSEHLWTTHSMKICVLLTFGCLLALIHGMPPLSQDYNTHCRCLQAETRIIPPDRLRNIKLVPKGPHCTNAEVIAILASGQRVCLDPQSLWVRKLVRFVLDKQLHQRMGVQRSRGPA
ncbi:C-X-C motif chemokine 19 [Dunckerocampus dactyliophorus]|uniref:C-X-C motif chemokine 19 n=1 Tax=Dunckerocampus dactyliophorus TaxID=161453 RepID=UPI002404F388|nr:C-X-C motif chemokine 19 [Dunckerocampus dactyliophorus]